MFRSENLPKENFYVSKYNFMETLAKALKSRKSEFTKEQVKDLRVFKDWEELREALTLDVYAALEEASDVAKTHDEEASSCC